MALVSYSGAARAFAERGQSEALRETLGDISTQAQRAADIIGRIRGFVRLQTSGFQDCTVNAVVSNVLALLGPEMRQQQVRVGTQLDAQLPAIRADRLLLEQVLLNLLLNAMQAMQGNPPADKTVQVDTGARDGMVFIRVADHGPGIAPAVQAQLFEPFFTTRAEGLGLGLRAAGSAVPRGGDGLGRKFAAAGWLRTYGPSARPRHHVARGGRHHFPAGAGLKHLGMQRAHAWLAGLYGRASATSER